MWVISTNIDPFRYQNQTVRKVTDLFKTVGSLYVSMNRCVNIDSISMKNNFQKTHIKNYWKEWHCFSFLLVSLMLNRRQLYFHLLHSFSCDYHSSCSLWKIAPYWVRMRVKKANNVPVLLWKLFWKIILKSLRDPHRSLYHT